MYQKVHDKLPVTFREMVNYGFVSVAALAVDLSLLALLKEMLHINYLVAATLSFVAGLVVNFLLSRRYVFKNSKLSNKSHEFIVFSVIGILGLAINDLIIYALTDHMSVFYFYSKLIATVIVFFWNFLLRKFILY